MQIYKTHMLHAHTDLYLSLKASALVGHSDQEVHSGIFKKQASQNSISTGSRQVKIYVKKKKKKKKKQKLKCTPNVTCLSPG
jgi:hypothetical protein